MATPKPWDDIDKAIYQARVPDRLTWREVAERIGLSHSSCRERFIRMMKDVTIEDLASYRAEENQKLDDLEGRLIKALNSVTGKAVAPIAQSLLRVHSRRAALNGLDQPRKLEVTSKGSVGSIDEQAMQLAEELKLMAGAAPVREE